MSVPKPPSPTGTEADDAVIAQALRRSLIALILVGALAAAIIGWLARPAPQPASRVTTLAAPTTGSSAVRPPAVRFTDVTGSAGVRFVHANGAHGEKLLPETMGG